MKCALGFVLMFALVALAGCDGMYDHERAEDGTRVRVYTINPSQDLRCADGVLYVRIAKDYTAKINKETLLPERCN
jgi:hypothetical protein